MSKKLTILVSLVVLLGTVGMARAELIGHWTLDETSGTVAADSSGRGHDGTYVNTPVLDIPGVFGTGMDTTDGYMEVDLGDDLPIQAQERTITLWLNTAQVRGDRKFVSYGSEGNGQAFTFCIENVDNADGVRLRHWGGNMFYPGFVTGEWNHLAMRVPAAATIVNDTEVFINGENIAGYRSGGSDRTMDTTATLFRVGTSIGGQVGQVFEGLFDDVHFFDHALSDAEVLGVMESQPRPYALGPNPADGSLLEAAWVNLSWRAGDFAVSHDVYVGDNFDDVNDGAEGTFGGNTLSTLQVLGFPSFPIPDGLQPGTTYYWRIDEVNDADPNSPWKGTVWSFTVPPNKAYDSDPADGLRFIDLDVTLSWTGGFGAKLHHVYFGDNFDDVSNASGALAQPELTFVPGALEMDKTYYWRVDEFDGIATHKGDVWAFTTVPVIPITDPNLVAWWTFDEGSGGIALDWSGHGNHGTLAGPKWTAASLHGDAALDSSGGGYVAIRNLTYDSTGLGEVTVCSWVRTDFSSGQYIVSFDRNEYYRLEINGEGGGPGQVGWDVMTSSGQVDYGSVTRIDNGAWHHIAGVFDNGRLTIYIDGVAEPSATGGATYGSGNTRFGFIGGNSEATGFNSPIPGGSPVMGEVDDVRIYDRALTQEEIVLVMRGDPLLAWAPSPSAGSTPDVDNVTPLAWTSGDGASSHEVYFGLDRDAVAGADTSDTTGVYRGRQNGTSFTPAEGVEWGGGPYYWRVDENNNDGTVTAGQVWSFTVADFILVDDIESYTDDDAAGEAIWQHWIDGFGIPTNGAQAGYLVPPYAEQTIV
ncbi:MAG: LamG domain-containing protein, partial [Planctomycetota bacterium]